MSHRRHTFGAHLCLSGLIAAAVLPCFLSPRAAAIIAVAAITVGAVLFFGDRGR